MRSLPPCCGLTLAPPPLSACLLIRGSLNVRVARVWTLLPPLAHHAPALSLLTALVAAARNYVRLGDGLSIIATPRMGPVAVPGDLRSVSGTGAVFNVYPFGVGDQIYFKVPSLHPHAAPPRCTTLTHMRTCCRNKPHKALEQTPTVL